NRTVALKLLKSTATEDGSSKSRFLREARLAATLEHPNICTIFDAGESAGHLFIAMQHVEGRTLRQAIDARPMDLAILLPLAIQSDRESPPLSRYSPEVPAELERIVSKALRKNRDERYQTIKDLLLDLQSLKQQLEFERTHRTRLTREDKAVQVSWVQARRNQLLGALCILMLVGGAILYAWWKQEHALSSQPEIKSLAVLP